MIKEELQTYLEEEIIPQYQAYDPAHQPDHVYQVIENSLEIAQNYPVDFNMVYTVAAYHDLGLKYGRQNHEKASMEMVLADNRLRDFFSLEEIIIIGQACQDHRASLKEEPRSIYGKIISEADRDIDFDRILLRTIQFELNRHPDLSYEEHFHYVWDHIKDKYGPQGSMKLWLNYKKNTNNLKYVHDKLADKDDFIKSYQEIYHSL